MNVFKLFLVKAIFRRGAIYVTYETLPHDVSVSSSKLRLCAVAALIRCCVKQIKWQILI